MSKGQKQVLYVVAAGVAAYLIYRWYTNRNAANATTSMVPGSATDPQYAALAGQQQSDMASLQRQILGLTQYERLLEKQIKKLQTGQEPHDRTKSVAVKKGSKLWDYYRKVTGKDPPARLQITNLIYELFQAGIPSRRAKELLGGNKPEHPNRVPRSEIQRWMSEAERNYIRQLEHELQNERHRHDPRNHRQVHHPNHGHKQRTGEHHRHPHSGGASPTPSHHKDHDHNKGTRPSGSRR